MQKPGPGGIIVGPDPTPVDEVLKMLERWHGTKFIVENISIIQIMEMMKYCIALDYKIDNNTITITRIKKRSLRRRIHPADSISIGKYRIEITGFFISL